jgi:hypothetical protein
LELLFCYFEFFSCFRAFFIAFPNDSDSGKRKFVEIIGEIREIPAKKSRSGYPQAGDSIAPSDANILRSNSANAVDRRARIPDRREAGQQRTSCRERERPANSDRMPAVRLRRRPDHDLRMRCSISLPRIATSIGSGAPGHISASHC